MHALNLICGDEGNRTPDLCLGIPLHTVAKLLGHSSIRTTEMYSHQKIHLGMQ